MPRTTLAALALLCAAPALADDPEALAFRDAFLGGADWAEVEARAREEGAVNLHYWGGSDAINVWMDRVAVPALAERGVTLNPVRITGTKDAVDLVLAERAAGRGLGQGSVDAIWLNGENFATLKAQGALFGAFAPRLPNAAGLEYDEADPRSQLNLRDFGVPNEGMEVPWSGEQYVCAVDTARAEGAPPATFEALRAYLEANPGKFTYVKPPNYLGNTFVQQAIYAHNPDGTGAEPFQASLDEIGAEELARLIAPGLEYLAALEPLLLGGDTGSARYPEDDAALDGMFRNGEIHFACKFGLYAVAQGQLTGAMPETAEQFVFPEGNMIANKSYLAIPANAPNPGAALVLADWMTSVESQASKLAATGMPAGLDPWRLSEADAAVLAEAAPGHVGITREALDANAAPDTNATLVDVIEATWLDYIERDTGESIAEIVARAAANAR